MLVESDEMVYDYDHDVVAAVGNVKIYYGGYTLEAQKVSYDRRSGRLVATGQVTLTDPTGASYYSEHIDITDDFRDGFVQSLRVDTAQHTYFAASRAERSEGQTTTFVGGVYTACEPCKEHPERPPLWDVKAAKIVQNGKTRRIYFHHARLEFFGLPIAWLPYFSVPDPTVSRATGLLTPAFGYSARVGAFLTTPYFWALAPNYDVTLTPTVLSRQGLLTELEWRHTNGPLTYSVNVAGIYQLDPSAFPAGSAARTTWRGGIASAGTYAINRDWTLGWNGTLLSDRGFGIDYGVLGANASDLKSTIYLTGLRGRNYFNAASSYYQVLTEPTAGAQYAQNLQAWVAPEVDYQRVADVFGGQMTFTTNIANVVRQTDDPFNISGDPTTYYHGVAGEFVRGTQEIAWQRRFVGLFGQVFKPFASVRGDLYYMTGNSASAVTGRSTATRFMPAVGLEWSWPILMTAGNLSQIIEPVAQVIVRPDETGVGTLPNNDAQSLVFDSSNLFTIDKFSGFDRIEGGTRANIGLRYHAAFGNGATIDGIAGQSIQLAGTNPFASDPISNVAAYSGLETTFSDYVAGLTVDSGLGARVDARARFDNATLALNRGELLATASFGRATTSVGYLYSRSDPNAGRTSPSSVIRGGASLSIGENWRAFGSITYDIAGRAIADDTFGLAFDNDCVTLSVAYSETRFGYTARDPARVISVSLALRTLAQQSFSQSLN